MKGNGSSLNGCNVENGQMSAQADACFDMIGYFGGDICNPQPEKTPEMPGTTLLCYSTVF